MMDTFSIINGGNLTSAVVTTYVQCFIQVTVNESHPLSLEFGAIPTEISTEYSATCVG
jgi:hypothetical protein